MTKKITALVVALALLVSLAACGKKDSSDAEFGWGTYNGTHYTNEFFNFEVDLPENYHQLTPQGIVDMNLQPDENGIVTPVDINSIEDIGAEAIVHFVYTTKYEEAPEGMFNPYINIFSENMQYSDSLYNKEDYVENNINYTARIFTQSGIGVKVSPLEKLWYGDRQFAKGSMKIDYDQFTMFQEMFALTKNNYSFVILIGYSNDAEKEELYKVLDSIKIK